MSHENCSPEEASLKSFFLGPQAENSAWVRHEVLRILDHWFQWRRDLFPEDGEAISRLDQKSPEFITRQEDMRRAIDELTRRLEKEIPQSPRYMGHMYSEISLPALLGHFAALLHNPNIISSEAARVGAQIENEAIAELARMIGFDPARATGHFTSGGTVANIEGLWRARYRMDHWMALGCHLNREGKAKLSYVDAAHMGWERYEKNLAAVPDETELRQWSAVAGQPWALASAYRYAFGKDYAGPVVLVPNSKHYSWQKAVSLLGFGEEAFWPVALDKDGVMDLRDLERKIHLAWERDRPVAMVVTVAGSTELGELDPVDRVQDLLDGLRVRTGRTVWHHVDAAYGGFFCALLRDPAGTSPLSSEAARRLAGLSRADSVTLDPHKLGYVPYACGALLVPDERRYRVSSFQAKYIQSPGSSDRWSRTLEGSRSAAGAAATWMTAKTIGMHAQGYGRILGRTLLAKAELQRELSKADARFKFISSENSNVLCFAIAGPGEDLSTVNRRTEDFVRRMNQSERYIVSSTVLQSPEYEALMVRALASWNVLPDTRLLSLARLVIMNPFLKNKETRTRYVEDFVRSARSLIS